jgi:hypothetical protein
MEGYLMSHQKINAMTQAEFDAATVNWTNEDWEQYEDFRTTDAVMCF